MEFLYMLGTDEKSAKLLVLIIILGFAVDYIRTTSGRMYRYRDISGLHIVKDRKTNNEYVESSDGHLHLLSKQ